MVNKGDTKPIIIIGGGISGITAAVEAAETGYEVILVEKLPYLGGRVVKLNKYFPKLCPPSCGLEINFRRIRQNPKIKIMVSTMVKSLSGKKGDFTVTLQTEPALVNNNCTSCGECTEVCPVERPDTFNYGHGTTKAIYLPHEMAYPFQYTIDREVCKGESCNKCMEVCNYKAIDLSQKESTSSIEVNSVILATGWKPYDKKNLGFPEHPDIISNVEMERLGAPNGPGKGKIQKPSNGSTPDFVVFVQCAGSRDENHLPYCSAVCCSASLKQALLVKEQLPDCDVQIFYIDLRVTGRNEDFLKKVEETEGIQLIKGKVANIEVKDKKIIVEAEDIAAGKKISTSADLVVLATGIVPENPGIHAISANNQGFLDNDSLPEGIVACGCAEKPVDVSTALKGATGAVLKGGSSGGATVW